MRETLGKMLLSLGEQDESLVLVTADVGDSTRAMYFREKFTSRYFNVGISEQHMVNFAAGLARAGFKPVVICFSMFLMRAWEQIRNSVCRMDLNVKFIATHSGLSDFADGSSHQALEDIALMRVIPGMKIFVPADSFEIERSLSNLLIENRGPLFYRIGRDFNEIITKDCYGEFELGKALVLEEGDDITLIGAGSILKNVLEACNDLRKLGIKASVLDMSSIKPIDENTIERFARRTGLIMTVEEHSIYGGLGSAVAEVIIKKYPVPMRIVGMNGFGRSARSYQELLEYFKLDKKSIVNYAIELLKNAKH